MIHFDLKLRKVVVVQRKTINVKHRFLYSPVLNTKAIAETLVLNCESKVIKTEALVINAIVP